MKSFKSYVTEADTPFQMRRTQDYDLIIVGGGPAGLTAAINGASEKLNVLIVDAASKLGGQARESWAIENYPGFPQSTTGQKLFDKMAEQAGKFGVNIQTETRVGKISRVGKRVMVSCESGDKFFAPAVIVATGSQHNRLPPVLEKFVRKGVYFGMPPEALKVRSQQMSGNVAVIGGGNSAGQAVLHLAERKAIKAKLIIRGELDGPKSKMSDYLIQRIRANKNIEVLENCEIEETHGDKELKSVKLKDGTVMPMNAIFTYIGSSPKTSWAANLDKDERGYIKTWKEVSPDALPYQTSMPGVFAVGDVRSGSIKRISACVGEGSAALQMVHAYMSATPEASSYTAPVTYVPKVPKQPKNPCKYPWQKDSEGNRCGKRATLAPKTAPMRSNIVVPSFKNFTSDGA